MQVIYNNCPVKVKSKPAPDKIRALAAAGLTREQIAKELGIKYKRFCYLVTTYYTLSEAFLEGKKEHQTNGKK